MKLTSAYIIGCITTVTAESLEESSRGSLITKVEKGYISSVDCKFCKCTNNIKPCDEICEDHSGSIKGGTSWDFYLLLARITPYCSVNARLDYEIQMPSQKWCQTDIEDYITGLVIEMPSVADLGLNVTAAPFSYKRTDEIGLWPVETEEWDCYDEPPGSLAYLKYSLSPARDPPLSESYCPVPIPPVNGEEAEISRAQGDFLAVTVPQNLGVTLGGRPRITLQPSELEGIECYGKIARVSWKVSLNATWPGLAKTPRNSEQPTAFEAGQTEIPPNILVGSVVGLLTYMLW